MHRAEYKDMSPRLDLPTVLLFYNTSLLAGAVAILHVRRHSTHPSPLLLIYAAYGLLALGDLRTRPWAGLGLSELPHVVLAALLAFVVAAPASWISSYDPLAQSYRAQQSYFGLHPSSVADTALALQSRPAFWRTEDLKTALGAGDTQLARQRLAAGGLPEPTALLGKALLTGLEGTPADGLALLPEALVLANSDRGWQAQASVVRGDLLRRMGDLSGARAAFTPRVVDDYNPVVWSWAWLHPSPSPEGRIDLGGNLDLGYISGFYLGEGDGKDTWRWSSGEAALRFPAAGTGAPQTLLLRIDGASVELPTPQFSVWLDGRQVAQQQLSHEVRVVEVPLPASSPGADVVVTLRSPIFVPAAADLLAQQGPQVGQLRLLGLRLDWAALQ